MRNLVLGSLGRRISWSLVTALLLPLLILAMPKEAKAQTTRIPSVAAIDFGVLAGVGATQIDGRNATDAVALEMTNTGRYEITPRTVLNQEIQKQGLSAPFNNIGIQRLGRALGVDYVLTGDIVNTTMTDNRVKVTLSVRLTDVVSGEFINGAVETGVSATPPPGIEPDRQAQLGQALSNAAFLAVRTMSTFNLPEATVLNTTNDQIYLNRGSRDGISGGLDMIVTRGKEQVGKIRVVTVQSTTAIARIVEASKGIRPEDHARAIVKIPGVTISQEGLIKSTPIPDITRYQPRQKNQKSALSTMIGVVGAVLLAGFLFSTRSSNQGAGVVGVQARAYADGSVSASLDPSAARVELRWQAAQDIPGGNILEYHIWRDGVLIGAVSRTTLRFIDDPVRTGIQNYNVVDYGNGSGIQFQPTTAGGTTTGGTTAGGTTAGGTTAGGTTTGGNTSSQIGFGLSLLAQTSTVVPMAVGVTHRYEVSVLYRAVQAPDLSNQTTNGGTAGGNIGGGGIGGGNIGGGGIGGGNIGGGNIGGGGTTGGTNNNSTTLFRESSLEARSGPATPLSRPAVTGPVSDQNMQRVTVTYQTVPGANEYVAEFSSTPDFKTKVQKGPFFANFTLGSATRTESYDLSTDFASLKAGSRIYYRVGARNSLDTPGPMGKDTANGDNYIYSQDLTSFAKISVPPAAP